MSAPTKAGRLCDVCGLPLVQQFPGDPLREWYWYCPREGLMGHTKANYARRYESPAIPPPTRRGDQQ